MEPFLCLSVSSNEESRMTAFSKFDIDGNGQVPIEEFSFVIMEFLNDAADGKGVVPLESIAMDIMPGGLKSAMELLLLVQKHILHMKNCTFIQLALNLFNVVLLKGWFGGA